MKKPKLLVEKQATVFATGANNQFRVNIPKEVREKANMRDGDKVTISVYSLGNKILTVTELFEPGDINQDHQKLLESLQR